MPAITNEKKRNQFRDLAASLLGEDSPVARFIIENRWGKNWSGHWADFIADCIYRQEGEYNGGQATVIAALIKKAESEAPSSDVLPTQNESYGFYGTLGGNGQEAWNIASTELVKRYDANPGHVRDLLDSKLGRYIGDEVVDAIRGRDLSVRAAVLLVVDKWDKKHDLLSHIKAAGRG